MLFIKPVQSVENIIIYIICLAFGGVGAWVIARLGSQFSLLDISNRRSSHEGVVPKGGGIGILASFVFASLFLEEPLAFWLPATFLALFSLLGDRIEISPKIRLPVQSIAALIFVLLSALSLQLSVSSFLFTVFFTLFIVATANWYNFMDGIDGIAAITGIVGFGLLALFIILSGGDSRFSVLSICIALSCLGFLPFNMPKAKVFMGDVGSILLGFVFATIVVTLSESFLDFVCLAAFLFPFYADEFVTMAVRIKDGENLLKAHRRHFYQLLANEMEIAHWKVSVGYGLLQLIVGLCVLLARPLGVTSAIVLLVISFGGFIWANYVVRLRVEEIEKRR
jgi:UDP-N-acetylmuramyl pentapeptide phosphotransferase/UDP-N-acetylglucosamine-1-phosphate transferase